MASQSIYLYLPSMTPSFHLPSHNQRIAYEHLPGDGPGIMFLCGFKSDMQGNKATALRNYCQQKHIAFTRFDYRGHGQSDAAFADCTISDWLDDAHEILTHIAPSPTILVGSSMGGWIMLLLAQKAPHLVHSLIGIASAADFTRRLMWDMFDTTQQATLMHDGQLVLPSEYEDDYIITRALIEDGDKHLMLDTPIELGDMPVTLFHGMQDADVPWQWSGMIAERSTSHNVQVHLSKSGDHRLSTPDDLARLTGAIAQHRMINRH